MAPSPTPSPTASPAPLRAEPAAIPPRFSFIGYAWGETARLWLVDLDFVRPPRVVASWGDRLGRDQERQYSVSADGRTIVVSSPRPDGRAVLHVIATETGTVRLLHEDSAADLRWPALTPDGSRVAFARLEAGRDHWVDDGIWLMDLARATPSRLVSPAGETTRPLTWSHDGEWLAFAAEQTAHVPTPSPIHLVRGSGGPDRDTGLVAYPDQVSWRSAEPRLLVATSSDAISGGTSEIRTYNVTTGASALVYRAPAAHQGLGSVAWHPRAARFLYVQYGSNDATVQVRDLPTASSTQLSSGRFIISAWWSPDGEHAYTLTGGDDSVHGISELGTGRGTHICTRSDDPTLCL